MERCSTYTRASQQFGKCLVALAAGKPHVVAALDNFYQIFVRVGQSLFSIVEGKLPDIYLINFKYERFLVETGMAMDSIMLKAGEKILYELSVGLSQGTAKEKEKNAFVLKNRPLEGPFTIHGGCFLFTSGAGFL